MTSDIIGERFLHVVELCSVDRIISTVDKLFDDFLYKTLIDHFESLLLVICKTLQNTAKSKRKSQSKSYSKCK